MRTSLLVLLLLLAGSMAAQSRNAAYMEIGGVGILPTANFERRFTDHVAGRIGLLVIASSDSGGNDDVTVDIPVAVTWISHPKSNHHFETGAGVVFVTGDSQDLAPGNNDESVNNFAFVPMAGYRYQKPVDGFVFRATFTPVLYEGETTAFAGLSFGYAW